jgi:hypothetical protein
MGYYKEQELIPKERKLKQENEKLKQENEKLKEQLKEIKSYLPKVSESSYAKLDKKLKIAVDALEFYAEMDKDNVRELCEARQALEKIGEK